MVVGHEVRALLCRGRYARGSEADEQKNAEMETHDAPVRGAWLALGVRDGTICGRTADRLHCVTNVAHGLGPTTVKPGSTFSARHGVISTATGFFFGNREPPRY